MKKIFKSERGWLNSRNGKITATRSAAIMGKSKYMTKKEVYEIIQGIKDEPNLDNNQFVQNGKLAEQHIRTLFAIDHPQFEVADNSIDTWILFIDEEYPFLVSSTDGLIKYEDEFGRKYNGLLEIKKIYARSGSKQDEYQNDKIPDDYYCQCLHELMVSKRDFLCFVAELQYSDTYTARRSYIIWREEVEDDIKTLRDTEVNFYYNNIEKNVAPQEEITFSL